MSDDLKIAAAPPVITAENRANPLQRLSSLELPKLPARESDGQFLG